MRGGSEASRGQDKMKVFSLLNEVTSTLILIIIIKKKEKKKEEEEEKEEKCWKREKVSALWDSNQMCKIYIYIYI